jgi:tetratricopeptide (TPR) repeat protein
MSQLKKLITEAHRRSLWQVLGIYLAVSWVVIQVVETLTESAGLPDWVPPFSLVLLLIGLPIVMATAFVQEGMGSGPARPGAGGPQSVERPEGTPKGSDADSPEGSGGPAAVNLAAGTGSLDRPSTRPSAAARLFTWKNAIVGGVLAFAGLGALVASYWFMWATGIGPVGSLVAQGVLEDREQVILADFVNSSSDAVLGSVVTDAFRVDLVESPVITLVDRDYVGQILRRMGRDPDVELTPDLAREAAVRDGIKAVVEGEVAEVAGTYVLTATLVEAQTGADLAAFRETAQDGDQLLAAIDKLSERLRERAGESLREIRAGAPLEEVTTSSLDALKLYAEAREQMDLGDYQQSVDLLMQAVESDSAFAMAWRAIAVSLGNMDVDRDRQHDALSRAYANRDRLTERERHLTTAHYHYQVTEDLDEVIRAYQRVLEKNPDDPVAVNNLAIIYNVERWEMARAEELLTRALNGPAESYSIHYNLVVSLFNQGKVDEAWAALDRWIERFPQSPDHFEHRVALLAHQYRWDDAEAYSDSATAAYPALDQVTFKVIADRGVFELGRGHVRRAEAQWREGFRRAVEKSRPDWAFEYARGLARIQQLINDRPDRALDEMRGFEEAFPLDAIPPLNRPYFQLIAMYARTGDPARARQLLAESEEALPPDEQGRGHRTRLLTARAHIALGEGNAEEARRLYEEYRRLETCGPCLLDLVAEAEAEAGQLEAAIASYEEWLAQPEFSGYGFRTLFIPVAFERLARLYDEMGDAHRAADYYEQFASFWSDPDPELQGAVRAARSRAATLRESVSD